jgi:hypothetical protein
MDVAPVSLYPSALPPTARKAALVMSNDRDQSPATTPSVGRPRDPARPFYNWRIE